MNNRPIVKKYARGLARAVEKEEDFEACLQQLGSLAGLMSSSKTVNYALTSAFISRSHKKRMAEEILKKSGFNPWVERLVRLLVENERMPLLPDILKELPEVWAEERGIETFEINSAVELTEKEKLRLKKTLEEKEKKKVRLLFRLNPEIIGGLVLRKGNIYYDASVKGGLQKLKEIVTQG
jgi:F-type H+-transporting ATPase subunit delta